MFLIQSTFSTSTKGLLHDFLLKKHKITFRILLVLFPKVLFFATIISILYFCYDLILFKTHLVKQSVSDFDQIFMQCSSVNNLKIIRK